jgi:hypothetical protein
VAKSPENIARNDRSCHHPGESPAKPHTMGGAVDAGVISRGSSSKTNDIAFSAVQPHRLEVLKGSLKTPS